jgi:hypothetical protein
MKNMQKNWVNCPICGSPDMEQTPDGEDGVIIECTNLCCASNGGDNYSEIQKRIEQEEPALVYKALERLKKVKEEMSKIIADMHGY